ncbi:MAG: hypothetical protein JNN07_01315 [Verrucomicrobiales bacterium]|nr:hypothetical protein [Verrucomicrobiales bacterium]
MTTKDLVYLSLLALSAIVFYWAGFYGGFNTTLRILKAKDDEAVNDTDIELSVPEQPLLSSTGIESITSTRRHNTVSVGSTLLPQKSNYFGRN